jgi:hypothetical protein
MSLNSANLTQQQQLELVPEEKCFQTYQQVRLEYESGTGYPGEGHNYFSNSGTVYLTNKRIVYSVLDATPDAFFKNLTIPLLNLHDPKLIQPWFNCNSFKGTVIPVINGGLRIPGTLQLFFTQGGAFEFHTTFLQLQSRLAETPDPVPDALPAYSPPST